MKLNEIICNVCCIYYIGESNPTSYVAKLSIKKCNKLQRMMHYIDRLQQVM